jgi:hypothetical protein
MMLPVGVAIDPKSGAMGQATGRYAKHLGETRGCYQDQAAVDALLAARGDFPVYEVVEFIQPGSDRWSSSSSRARTSSSEPQPCRQGRWARSFS